MCADLFMPVCVRVSSPVRVCVFVENVLGYWLLDFPPRAGRTYLLICLSFLSFGGCPQY